MFEVRNMKVMLLLLVVLHMSTEIVATEKRQFTWGFINDGNLQEYEAVQFAINLTNNASNDFIALEIFNVSNDERLLDQADLAFLHQNVTVLIEGIHAKTSACAFSTVTGIPLVRLYGNGMVFDQCARTVDISADYRHLAHATYDLVNRFSWKKLSLIFDESQLLEAAYFYTTFKNTPLVMNFIRLSKNKPSEDKSNAVMRAMEEIQKFDSDVILLYTDKETTELTLQQEPCNLKRGYRWILQGQISQNLKSLPNNVVLAFKPPSLFTSSIPGHPSVNTVMRDHMKYLDKDLTATVYDAVQVINRALNTEPCLTLNGSNNRGADRETMFNCLMKVNISGFTGPIQFDANARRREIELEVLNLRNNSLRRIGTWNSSKGTVLSQKVLPNVFKDSSEGELETRKYKVVVLEDPPFIMMKKNKDGVIFYEGYNIDLLNELKRILKFKYELYLSPDGKYGTVSENGTWDGMMREILDGGNIRPQPWYWPREIYQGLVSDFPVMTSLSHADMSAGAIAVTESREKVADFSIPYMYYTEDLIMKKQSPGQDVDLLQFMNPFENQVWFCTLATLVIISVAVFVINYYSPYGYKDENGRGTADEFNFFNSVWFALACMLQQGADNTPRNLSGRILTGCYWFCILIWVSTYTANLAAFLTVKNAESPITNLEDTLKTTHQVGVIASSSTLESIKHSTYEPHQKIWQRMKSDQSFVQNTSQGVQWVREKNNFVFINDGTINKHIANQQPCDLTTVPGLSRAKGLALVLPPNDPHTTNFTLAILRLHENDFLDHLKRKWWDGNNQCPKEQDTTLSRQRIDVMSMLGVYLVMGAGLVLAILTLIAEIIWKRKVTKKWSTKVGGLNQSNTAQSNRKAVGKLEVINKQQRSCSPAGESIITKRFSLVD